MTKSEAIARISVAAIPEAQRTPEVMRALDLIYDAGHIEGHYTGSIKAIKEQAETFNTVLDAAFGRKSA